MENIHTLSGLNTADFQKNIDGKETSLTVLTSASGAEVTISNYGARIVSFMVPDRNGKLVDIVTGHSSIDDYLTTEEPYFGAVCGRYANRIANGRFTLDGIVYDKLAINNGPNTLHGGVKGFNSVVWDIVEKTDSSVEFKYLSADGEEGFPGNLKVNVTYILKDNVGLIVLYEAESDKPTVINLTNHAYFNLSGAGDPDIGDHLLHINADYYLPIDETAIPYGDKAPVKGTPMDFSEIRRIGEHINDDFEQLKFGKGYDHTYILIQKEKKLLHCACVTSPKTGISLNVYTNEPGVQLYTGNWMTGNCVGKHGQRYPMRSAFCLETQHFPDSPNKPEYPSTELRPGKKFISYTLFEFDICKSL